MKQILVQKIKHSPTLNTILMVEETIQIADESIVTAYIKKHLPRQVNHNTLMDILQYLEDSNKIVVSLRGITWIHNKNPKLKKAINGGLEL